MGGFKCVFLKISPREFPFFLSWIFGPVFHWKTPGKWCAKNPPVFSLISTPPFCFQIHCKIHFVIPTHNALLLFEGICKSTLYFVLNPPREFKGFSKVTSGCSQNPLWSIVRSNTRQVVSVRLCHWLPYQAIWFLMWSQRSSTGPWEWISCSHNSVTILVQISRAITLGQPQVPHFRAWHRLT